jgi:hypothetical protein
VSKLSPSQRPLRQQECDNQKRTRNPLVSAEAGVTTANADSKIKAKLLIVIIVGSLLFLSLIYSLALAEFRANKKL